MLFYLFRESLKKPPGYAFQTYLDMCDFYIHIETYIFFLVINMCYACNFLAFCCASVVTFVSPWQATF